MKPALPKIDLGIDRALSVPVYLQICQRFKTAIAQGHLRSGDRVPAVRGLAMELSVARGTVEMAYRILTDEGYLQVRGAAGTIVSPALPVSVSGVTRAGQARPGTPGAPGAPTSPQHGGGTPKPFQLGLPAIDAFPRKVWNRLVAHRLRSGDASAFAYPDPAGYWPLRERIATYLGLSRGVECVPEQVFVTTGYRATLELVLRSLATPDDAFWFEDPGYILARRFLLEVNARLVPVPIDKHGICVEHGLALKPDARFAVVTPSHQSPMGVTLSLERRMALLDWSAANGSWVIEDDYDSEFRYAGRPLPALKSLDRHDRVIYSGTFSKVMFPGLRLAYVVAPVNATQRFHEVCASMNAGSPYLLQASVTDFMAEGHFARHLKKMRLLYAQRRDVTARALAEVFGERLAIDLPPGGLQMAARFVDGTDDTAVADHARASGFGEQALSRWYMNAPPQSGLVLGFANVASEDQAMRRALELRRAADA
ncbi:PLP-dependent aminotransferase family protein [Caballeronia sp. DA-9]|uniref:MocR-like pyridoxine biosynthesis transcription factor PdxR n=1 Tax=Caballeronia sp. DA-9 TaxID=3436237 RepID=UPI003F66CA70